MKTIIKNKTYTHISLDEVKAHLRISTNYTAEDTQLTTLLKVATSEAESYIENRISLTSLETKLTAFTGSVIEIEEGNLSSVTSVEINGVATTEYTIDNEEFRFTITLTDAVASSDIVINYVTGFSSVTKNEAINQAILIRLADRYEVTRSSYHTAGYATNNAFEMLLNPFKKLTIY